MLQFGIHFQENYACYICHVALAICWNLSYDSNDAKLINFDLYWTIQTNG